VILDVLIEGGRAGTLDLTRPNAPIFIYDGDHMSNPRATPLSTRFPLIAPKASGAKLLRWLEGL
ncbi:MAG: HipA N-terminal domain-containing protein, partial [Acidimicrobiaceae bacterium]|nr:HipA N-terminal domain-containing protein [Acidimicrobiaceae bacterium]